jgi:hypothetical protein
MLAAGGNVTIVNMKLVAGTEDERPGFTGLSKRRYLKKRKIKKSRMHKKLRAVARLRRWLEEQRSLYRVEIDLMQKQLLRSERVGFLQTSLMGVGCVKSMFSWTSTNNSWQASDCISGYMEVNGV